MISVKVLGTGCAKCKSLEKKVRHLVEKKGLDVEVNYVDDIQEMISLGILMTPGLVINGEVKSVGIIPKTTQLLEWMGE